MPRPVMIPPIDATPEELARALLRPVEQTPQKKEEKPEMQRQEQHPRRHNDG